MATFVRSERIIEALGVLGIGETDRINRVVIDLKVGNVPQIHVQRHGDSRLIELVEALDGPRIVWINASGPVTYEIEPPEGPAVNAPPDPLLRGDSPA